ncbi:condensation domain-containing protein, partial [Lentilitoribacter sp. EG35]|uniref:condensation domain-containing protein n=1 Tax=Lentilitoribacter sp. EG35 TaxID=3234192 RepID=UPI00346082DE
PDHLPLSYAQRRLWLLGQIDGVSSTYNIPMALRLSGALNVAALSVALEDVVARHESLRTTFVEVDGVPYQQITEIGAIGSLLEKADITEAELSAALSAAAGYCFDLATELPIRGWLYHLNADQHVLLLVIHHIAGDGWSFAPLAKDLTLAYEARIRGEAPDWVPLPVQYADYTLWQHELLGDESDSDSAIAHQLSYWQDTLKGLPEQLDLPVDRPRPTKASHRGGYIPITITSELHGKLLDLAREAQSSLFMVLQAGLAALLTRLGAGNDIPLGSPIAGRMDDALDELVGFFVNTLVLRTDTSGNPSFRELLSRVRETDLQAYAHQDIPFERLVEALNPTRSFASHPLFQVMLALQNNVTASLDLPSMEVTAEPVDTDTAKFDLWFSFSEQRGDDGKPQGLVGQLEYACDLFDEETVETLMGRLVHLFELVVDNPDHSIGSFELLDEDERQKILFDWNDTTQPIPDATLPELFEA